MLPRSQPFRPRLSRLSALGFLIGLLMGLPGLGSDLRAQDRAKESPDDFFEREIRPLLLSRCTKCHGGEKTKGGLKLTSRESILQGGDTGPAALPGKPAESLLIQAIQHEGALKMPPKEKLTSADIARLTRWVQLGLPWPRTPAATPPTSADNAVVFTEEQRRWWSFQPVHPTNPPPVRAAAWPQTPVDQFILAELERRGLAPAKVTDKRTLLRRATYDLTGLPPTPAELDAFLADRSPDAFARVVDRLLASPAYGEKWGRYWLDVVRFTDSFDARIVTGAGSIMDITESHRYRDWVVKALNADMPYDQFIIHQIAGDLLPPKQPDGINTDGIVATGLLAIGNWGGGDADKEKLLTDIADDQIDVVNRAFLGLTMACARCHDHKFDPFTMDDYYGLAGIFFSCHILADPGPKTNGPPMLRIPLISKTEMTCRQQREVRASELEKEIGRITTEQQRAAALQALHQTAACLNAVWESQARGSSGREPLAAIARKHQITEARLHRWLDYLGCGELPLLQTPVRDLLGRRGLHVLRGASDTPSVTVNSTDQALAYVTIQLPPRSLAVHPSPTGGVGIAWRSPITSTVRISGRIADADATCGDGVAWVLEQQRGLHRRTLAAGEIANGGQQTLTPAPSAGGLDAVSVNEGDQLRLIVLPKKGYECDTTVVELRIAEPQQNGRVWDLRSDVVPALHASFSGTLRKELADRRAAWSFFDAARQATLPAPPGSALAEWLETVSWAGPSAEHQSAIRAASQRVQNALLTLKESEGPNASLRAALTAPQGPFGDEPAAPVDPKVQERLAGLRLELNALRQGLAEPIPFANGAQEGGCPLSPQAGIHDVRIHLRGRYDRLGKPVPRHFPRILAGDHQAPITQGSGRLQLAQWIASPTNPLTARVIVNRLWQYHFGVGLVRTPGNFGKLGERPTHPELLDYLADRLVRSGWSLKALHRLLMLSAVYQQSSLPEPATVAADPENRLFGRMHRRRLEAEEIRDAMLAVTDRLDRRLGGRAVTDLLSPRRTLYLMTNRSDRASFRMLFDAPDPTAIADRRLESTVAPQALFLLNSPLVNSQAKALAQRVHANAAETDKAIDNLYLRLFARPPTARERALGLEMGPQGWEPYCQMLLCLNEFVYVD